MPRIGKCATNAMVWPMDDYNNLDAWLEAVRRQLGTDLALSIDDQRALLDLTRVAAHRSQRIAAPLTAFLAGMALADLPVEQRAAAIDRLTAALEAAGPVESAEPEGGAP